MSPRLEASHLDRINSHIYRGFGIHIAAEKRYLLESRVAKILSREGFSSAEEFVGSLDAGHPTSWEALVRHTTTNHTYFFREASHFTFLADEILKRRSASAPVIWSAACSTGEEPYSLILTLLERGLREFLVVASDINPDVLRQTAQGVFPAARMSEVPTALREKYFRPAGRDQFQISSQVKRHLSVKRINLIEPLRFSTPVDHILCRNLLIYFDQTGSRKVLENLVSNLKPGGNLLIGKSEVLVTPPAALRKLEGSIYQKEPA